MKIYTRMGDSGQTSLLGGVRVRKDDLRIEAYGTVDELNAVIGLVRSEELPKEIDALLANIQNELFELGAELATPESSAHRQQRINDRHAADMEEAIDQWEVVLKPLRQFILPGGTPAAAGLHLARTVCRRAERHVVTLRETSPVSEAVLVYLNRLSDLLFVLARATNHEASRDDVPWEKAE